MGTCSPSMSAELTLEHTVTGRSCMKEVPRLSGQKCWSLAGRKSLPNGQRDQRQGCPNGLESVQAKRQEILILLRVKKMLRRKTMMKRKRRGKRRKRRSKLVSLTDCVTASLPLYENPIFIDVTLNHSIRVIASIPSV